MNKKNGFTLIELLVAMGIIAVLTGMAVFNFNQARVRARDIQRKNDLSQIQKSLEVYKNDNNGIYPAEANFQNTLRTGGYTKTEFNDPRDGEWSDYYYVPSADFTTYYLMACLENNADSTKTSSATSGDICASFTAFNPAVASACKCGANSTDTTGVMYTLSQP
jgi:prepilin-type N-terminal cleavage/methylation domain-containing protein